MSRSGYMDDIETWDMIRWRGQVASAIRGKRGQAFLLEMWKAMQSLPEHKLIAKELQADGAVCALGSVGKARGINMVEIDPEDQHDTTLVLSGLELGDVVMLYSDTIHATHIPKGANKTRASLDIRLRAAKTPVQQAGDVIGSACWSKWCNLKRRWSA